MSATTEKSSGNTAVRPFTIPVTSEAELEALRSRVASTRWPDQELVADHSQGVQMAVITELARYWATEYDWRRISTGKYADLAVLTADYFHVDDADISRWLPQPRSCRWSVPQ